MDITDKKIINLLKENSRMTYTDIGKRVNLTSPAVKNRMEILEHSQIEKYTIALKDNGSIQAIVLFKTNNCKKLIDYFNKNSDVKEYFRISGEYNYFAKVSCKSTVNLDKISSDTNDFAFSISMIKLSN